MPRAAGLRAAARWRAPRWAAVAAGVALLCALPAIIGAWPVPAAAVTAGQLRARIAASPAVAYQGYAESTAAFGLPSLPGIGQVSALLDGSTDQQVWYRSASSWRADVVTAAGESDTYQAGTARTYQWSYASRTLTELTGSQPVRLPRAADLLPPALAQRLVSYAGPGPAASTLPARRIAGIDAAGLRLQPAGPVPSVVRAADIWADPRTGLPVEVDIFARGLAAPALVSKFLQVSLTAPAAALVRPSAGPGVQYAAGTFPDVRRILSQAAPQLPPALIVQPGGQGPAGLPQVLPRVPDPAGLPDVAAYGTGLARFAVVPLPGRDGTALLRAAAADGAAIQTGNVTAVLIQTPLLTVLVAQPPRAPVYVLAGTATAPVLEQAATQLRAAAPR